MRDDRDFCRNPAMISPHYSLLFNAWFNSATKKKLHWISKHPYRILFDSQQTRTQNPQVLVRTLMALASRFDGSTPSSEIACVILTERPYFTFFFSLVSHPFIQLNSHSKNSELDLQSRETFPHAVLHAVLSLCYSLSSYLHALQFSAAEKKGFLQGFGKLVCHVT